MTDFRLLVAELRQALETEGAGLPLVACVALSAACDRLGDGPGALAAARRGPQEVAQELADALVVAVARAGAPEAIALGSALRELRLGVRALADAR